MDLFESRIESFKAQKLYRGCVSLRSYDVDRWVKEGVSVRVTVDGENGYMLLDTETLSNPEGRGETMESRYEGGNSYHLVDYKWEPTIDDRESKIIQLIGEQWYRRIGHTFDRPYMKRVQEFLNRRRQQVKVYPSPQNVFRAFKVTPYNEVKIVMLGQDPYYNGSADGLAFSSPTKETPKSLQVIFKEIKRTHSEFNERRLADLSDWSKQGIFLFNTILTVDAGSSMSHSGKGWEQFSTEVIIQLNKHPNPLVFVLWGSRAKEYRKLIDYNYHLILESPHPAAELHGSASFIGNGHFEKIDKHLKEKFNLNIKW